MLSSNHTSGVADVTEFEHTSHDRSADVPNPLNVPLPGTPLVGEIDDAAEHRKSPGMSELDIVRDEHKNGETFVV